MRRILHIVFLVAIMVLGVASCKKELTYQELFYNSIHASAHGDEKKIDVKGSLMNGDMKTPNIEAWLAGNTLYVCFYETIENCLTLVSAKNGDVLFSRRMAKQYPCVVRVFMGNEPTGNYHLYITDGNNEAEGDFYYSNEGKIKAES